MFNRERTGVGEHINLSLLRSGIFINGDAFTRWNFRWSWPGYGSSTCDLARATVTLSIVVSFPRWTHPVGASPGVVADWGRYTRALALHEQGHVDYARARDPFVLRAIRPSEIGTMRRSLSGAQP